jgi:hypothetical protein
MRCAVAFLSATILLTGPSFAQNSAEVADLAHHPLEAEFPSGGQLDLHIRPAEIRIVGSEKDRIAVSVSGRQGGDSTGIGGRFERTGNSGKLRVAGGPSGNVTLTVEVPRKSNLMVRVFAGDLEVTGITGSKNIELHAGDLTIDVGDPADYYHVQASVTTGSIAAEPFGESRDGLFRSFEKSGHGDYKLVAHVGAGDLRLK